uniref:Uncharacterized protein n=1 Tax=Candidatus Kentrum sp. FW TaxID=2126338 RepID=A0A450U4I8_9GAMM|nr:MAG: hypothetical protein BECKFW1821C_GA0114237_12044 [Candidatus Kentron sp. FW]
MILAHDTVRDFALIASGIEIQCNNITQQHRRFRPASLAQTRLAGLGSNGGMGIRVVVGSRIALLIVGRLWAKDIDCHCDASRREEWMAAY